MRARNALLSIGAAIASTKLVHMLSDLGVDDVLQPIGLSRHRPRWPLNLAFLGAGIAVGGVTALLLAPSSGQQTRARLAKKADDLGEAASKKAREIGQQIRDEMSSQDATRDNGHSGPAHEPT